MPQATNLVLKNAAGTDITFALLSPAAGYGGLAEWRYDQTIYASANPTITAMATKGTKSNKDKFRVVIPLVNVENGIIVSNRGNMMYHIEGTIPNEATADERALGVALVESLAAHVLFKGCMRDGLPAT